MDMRAVSREDEPEGRRQVHHLLEGRIRDGDLGCCDGGLRLRCGCPVRGWSHARDEQGRGDGCEGVHGEDPLGLWRQLLDEQIVGGRCPLGFARVAEHHEVVGGVGLIRV